MTKITQETVTEKLPLNNNWPKILVLTGNKIANDLNKFGIKLKQKKS